MKKVSMLLLCISLLTQSALIGNITLSLQKVKQMEKSDPAFKFTKQKVNTVFKKHCGIELQQAKSISYLIVQGVRYTVEFETDYGIVNVTALTIIWENSTQIYKMAIKPSPQLSCVKPVQDLAKAKTTSKQTFEFPELKATCDTLKLVFNKLKSAKTDAGNKNTPAADCEKILASIDGSP